MAIASLFYHSRRCWNCSSKQPWKLESTVKQVIAKQLTPCYGLHEGKVALQLEPKLTRFMSPGQGAASHHLQH